ncbi:MAG: hypothetical protein ACO3N4_10325 [Ilumatobacteraceae bacterium]
MIAEEHAALSRATDAELRQARAELGEMMDNADSALARQLLAVQRARCGVALASDVEQDERRVAAVKLEEVGAALKALEGGLLVCWAADCALHAALVLRTDMRHAAP